jgi:hypothetical protein
MDRAVLLKVETLFCELFLGNILVEESLLLIVFNVTELIHVFLYLVEFLEEVSV